MPVRQPPRGQQPLDPRAVGWRGLAFPAPSTGGEQRAGAAVDGDERGELVERLADRSDDDEAQHPQHRAERQPDGLERQRRAAAVGEQREEGRAALLVVGVPTGERRPADAPVSRLCVEDHGLGHDQRRVTGRSGAPAEIDVVAEHRQLRVEPAELGERRTTDQEAGAVDGQHLTHLVVLTLVVLTALEAGLPAAGAADRHPDLEQPSEGGPLAQLGAEEVGLGTGGRGPQQLLERVGRRVAVVVQQPDPLGRETVVRQGVHRQPDGAGVRRTAALSQDDGSDRGLGAEGGLDQVGAAVLAARVDGEHAGHGCGLGPDAVEDRRQPRRPVVADEHHGDVGHEERAYRRVTRERSSQPFAANQPQSAPTPTAARQRVARRRSRIVRRPQAERSDGLGGAARSATSLAQFKIVPHDLRHARAIQIRSDCSLLELATLTL